MPPVLVTGAAGFIGYHTAERFLLEGREVVGLDIVNDYYDIRLKEARLERLAKHSGFTFAKLDLADAAGVMSLFKTHGFEIVINLAAQAGVRYSLINPQAYVRSNIEGFINILEACRHTGVSNLLYASSSSVYGAVTKTPFSVDQNVDHPVSLYAASKKANELIAHSYSHLFRLPTTGLRFFTVYGPWGRPDMAMFLFTRAMIAGEPIEVFNYGEMQRDFTYIDDIVEGIYRLSFKPAEADPLWSGADPEPASSNAPWRVYNIGNNKPVQLMHMINVLEKELDLKATMKLMPLQPGDVRATFANVDALVDAVGFKPETTLEDGVARFVRWYKAYYNI